LKKKKWSNEEIFEYRREHGSYFYYNKQDSNLLIPKSFGIGRTLNFANPLSWVFIALIAAAVIYKVYFK